MKNNQGTLSVWGGESSSYWKGSTQPPIVNSVTFEYKDLDEWYNVALEKKEGFIYSRSSNPTVSIFEQKMAVLEDAESAVSFSSGMAAISNTLMALLSSGEQIVTIKDTYGGTNALFLKILPRFGIYTTLCETTNLQQIEKEIEKGCKVVYLESPTNPTLKILDIKKIATKAKQANALVIVDNTFATPINQNPLVLGADLVIHSATKFISGHSDVLGGVVCGKKELIKKIYQFKEINGASLPPNSAYQLIRSLKTLELRMQRHNENAIAIANFLKTHPKVRQLFYPGLESDPGHTIARSQMRGFGGVVSFSINGNFETVKQFLPKLRYAHLAANLGSVDTLVGTPRTTSHVENTPQERKNLGIPETLIRYSTGIENVNDLIQDLTQALESID